MPTHKSISKGYEQKDKNKYRDNEVCPCLREQQALKLFVPRLANVLRATTESEIVNQDNHTIRVSSETSGPVRSLLISRLHNDWKTYMPNRSSKQKREAHNHKSHGAGSLDRSFVERNEIYQNRDSRPPCMTTGRMVGSTATLRIFRTVETKRAGILTRSVRYAERAGPLIHRDKCCQSGVGRSES